MIGVAERNVALIQEENLKEIEEHMQRIAELAASCNISKEELVEMFYVLTKEDL